MLFNKSLSLIASDTAAVKFRAFFSNKFSSAKDEGHDIAEAEEELKSTLTFDGVNFLST